MAMLCERVGKARHIRPFGFFILSTASKNSCPSNCVGPSFHGNHVHSQKSGIWMGCWLLWRLSFTLAHSITYTAHIQLWCPSTLQWHLNLDISPFDWVFVAFFLFEHGIFLFLAVSDGHLLGPFLSIHLKLSWKTHL